MATHAQRGRHRGASRAPLHRRPRLIGGLVLTAATAVLATLLLGQGAAAPAPSAPAAAPATTSAPTAPTTSSPAAPPTTAAPAPASPWANLGANAPDPGSLRLPTGGQSLPAWVRIGESCAADDPYRTEHCHVLGTSDGAPPKRTIVTLGNSHTVQLSAALLEAVDRRSDWALRAQASPGCPFAYTETPTNPCEEMWRAGTRYVLEQQPDLVLVMATRSHATDDENLLPGLVEWVQLISDRTTSRVVVVRDSPRFSFDMLACAQRHGPDSPECAVRTHLRAGLPTSSALRKAGAVYVDLTPQICPDGVCRPVVGGVWTYIDDNHLGADFWRTLAAPLSRALAASIDWWPARPYDGAVVPRAKNDIEPVV